MGYATLGEKKISRALFRRRSATTGAPVVEAMRKRRIVHRASVAYLLIFCKRLSPAPFRFGGAK
jgi:hypothetical protein